MPALLARKKVLLAKKEVTYATDPVPTGAANAILASNISIVPLDTIERERDTSQETLGNDQSLIAGKTVRCSFEVEIAGSGTAGNAPAWAPLIEACGFEEALTPATSAVYTPISGAIPSLSFYYNVDGVKHAVVGARASRFGARFTSMEIPRWIFEFIGLYVPVADAALPAATLTGFKTPLVVNNDNTSGFSIHGFAGILQSVEVDFGLVTTYRNLVGEESVELTDRKPQGTMVMQAVTVSDKDVWALSLASTLGALSLLHGTAAGNKVQIDAPKVQLLRPGYSDQDGVLMLNAGLRFMRNAGDDEFVITCT